MIEGPPEAMHVLLRRIEADLRHGQMQIVLDESTGRRWFDEWNMGFSRAPAPSLARSEPTDLAAGIRAWLGRSTSRHGIEEILLSFPRWR